MNQKSPIPNNPAKKLLPGRLDKINPTKKQIMNGTYHGKNIVNIELNMRMIKIFIQSIMMIYFFLIVLMASSLFVKK